jgi:hypothetical protein
VEAKYEGKGKAYGRAEFDAGLGEYAAVTDIPPCFLWEEMMRAYPEAKVVLVERDFDRWWKSFDETAVYALSNPGTRALEAVEGFLGTYVSTMSRKLVLGYFGISSIEELDKEKAREVWDRHYRDIRKACEATPGRLLNMRLEDGWEPLCKCLNKPVPATPFPRVNGVEVQRKLAGDYIKKKLAIAGVGFLKLGAPIIAVAVATWWYFHRRA